MAGYFSGFSQLTPDEIERLVISLSHLIAAAIYFLVGVALGMYMGITGDIRLLPVHVHVIALGWISLSIIALIYEVLPHIKFGWIPKAHLWLHNLGLLTSMVGLVYMQVSGDRMTFLVTVGGAILALGVVLWALQLISGLVHKW